MNKQVLPIYRRQIKEGLVDVIYTIQKYQEAHEEIYGYVNPSLERFLAETEGLREVLSTIKEG